MAGNWVVVWTSTTVGAPIPGKARPMALQNFREFDDHNEAVCFVMEQLSANEQTSSRLAASLGVPSFGVRRETLSGNLRIWFMLNPYSAARHTAYRRKRAEPGQCD
jgi:hypothetical protein